MKDILSYDQKADLLYKWATDSLDKTEREVLETWASGNPKRQKYLQQLRDPQFLEQEYHQLKATDSRSAMAEMQARIDRYRLSSRLRIAGRRWIARAAAVAVIAVAGATIWYHQYTKVTPPVLSKEIQQAMQASRRSGAEGAQIASVDRISPRQRAVITRQLKRYHIDSEFAKRLMQARKVTTYHDKEFWLTLDDGTLVHLNYDSRLIYPEKFGSGQRDVILEGEAYFMVAKDRSRPFIVHTPRGDVKEYGTEFNVSTRGKDGSTLVVLVSGSISVTPTGGREQMMRPGQMTTLTGESVMTSTVDTQPYVAWNTGEFSFIDWPLERIMNVLARWYSLEINYGSDDIRNLQFSGNFSRYEDIAPTIETIHNVTGLRIEIHGNTITINK